MKTIQYIVKLFMLVALLILATACETQQEPECLFQCYEVQYAVKTDANTVELYLKDPCGFDYTFKSSEPFELVNYDRFNLNVVAICKDDLDALGYEL